MQVTGGPARKGGGMQLNPQQSLEQLRTCVSRLTYKEGDRGDEARSLELAITRAEIESANLSRNMDDWQQRKLYNELLCQTELARGTLREEVQRRRWHAQSQCPGCHVTKGGEQDDD